jgi:uncharacterized protein
LVISLPLYVCATSSVPIAAVLVAGGLPPSAALVFLMAGPATNIAAIGAILSPVRHWATTSIYLVTIIVGSILFAVSFRLVGNGHADGNARLSRARPGAVERGLGAAVAGS